MSFSANEIAELPRVISTPRFATYLQATGGDAKAALSLYLWNLEISAAFLVPLQLCEVAIRNGVVEALERVHGPDWPWSGGFHQSLPKPISAAQYNPASNLKAVATKHRTSGKVVADLNFAFWEKLFTAGQDDRLWRPHMRAVFPNLLIEPIQNARAEAFRSLQMVRRLRNRIAHHEPIFYRPLDADYERLMVMIGWRSAVAAQWMRRQQNVTRLLASRALMKS